MRVLVRQEDFDICDPGTFGKVLEDNAELLVTVTQVGCPKCRTYRKAVKELEDEIEAPRVEIELTRMADDPCQRIADLLKANDLPTVVYFRRGEEKGRVTGTESKEDMKARIRSLLRAQ